MKSFCAIASLLAFVPVVAAVPRIVVSVPPVSSGANTVVTVTASEPILFNQGVGVYFRCASVTPAVFPCFNGYFGGPLPISTPDANNQNFGQTGVISGSAFTAVANTNNKQWTATVQNLGGTATTDGSGSFTFWVGPNSVLGVLPNGAVGFTGNLVSNVVSIIREPGNFPAILFCSPTDPNGCPLVGARPYFGADQDLAYFTQLAVQVPRYVVQLVDKAKVVATNRNHLVINSPPETTIPYDWVLLPGLAYFKVDGVNNQMTEVTVQAGAFADSAGNTNIAATGRATVVLQYRQDCKRLPDVITASTTSQPCVCSAGQATGTQTRTVAAGATVGPFNLGLACAAAPAPRTISIACTCPQVAECAQPGRCTEGNSADPSKCSCGPQCYSAPGGCCSDVPTSCPNNLPTCGASAGEVPCGAMAWSRTGSKPICGCDWYSGANVNPDYRPCQQFSTRCQANYCTATASAVLGGAYTTSSRPAWCFNGQVGTTPIAPASGCSCSPSCVSLGNCCSDVPIACNFGPTDLRCGSNPDNCGKIIGEPKLSPDKACLCDRNAAFRLSSGGDLFRSLGRLGLKPCVDAVAVADTQSPPRWSINVCGPAQPREEKCKRSDSARADCGTWGGSSTVPNRKCDCTNTCQRAQFGSTTQGTCCGDIFTACPAIAPPVPGGAFAERTADASIIV